MPKADTENLVKIDHILKWSWLLRLRDEKGWRPTFYTTGDGILAHERDGHRVGTHAVARDAAGGVGGVKEQRPMKRPMTTGPGSPMARQIVR